MKVIFIKDLRDQGKKNEIKEVTDGYANNFLIKNGYAVKYTKVSSDRLEKDIQDNKNKEEQNIKEAITLKEKIDNIELKFSLKTGVQDKLFGSISAKQITEELQKHNINIDKKKLISYIPLSSLGYHYVKIELHKKVIVELKVEITKK